MKRYTDRDRLRWLIKVGVINGEWKATDSWPDWWDADVMRDVTDAAMRASEKAGRTK